MQNPLSHYKVLAKRWVWLVVLGIVFCGGAAYAVSKFVPPVYQASAFIVISIKTSTSVYDNFNTSVLAVPTYAQLLTNSAVLEPVLAQHPGLTIKQLRAMMTVKPQSNTQIIELDVTNSDPQMALQLANDIGQSLITFSNPQAPGAVQALPAELPTDPIYPKPLQNAGLGAVAGLGLAIALIFIFEWIDDRLTSPREARELLGLEILTVIPRLSRKHRSKTLVETPAWAERYRALSAHLIAAQAVKPFKLVMVTSAVANEGKSTVAANVAAFLAIAGKQVLLVDANLYHPVLDQRFQLDNRVGFSSVFLEKWTGPGRELYGQPTTIPTLRVLTAGKVPSTSPEMLQSPLANQLFEHFKQAPFDYIIFDTPPLLPVADAQILALLVHAIVLVVDANKTPRRVPSQARSILNMTRTTILGVTINKSPWADESTMRRYANHTWQPATNTVMLPNNPPTFMVRHPGTPILPLMTGAPDAPRSLIRPPLPGNGTGYSNPAIISGPQQQAGMHNHRGNGYLQYDTREQR